MSEFLIQGYQGDAHGQLTGRRANELLISLSRNGLPTDLSANNFLVTPMLAGVLPAKVVAVFEYGDGAMGLMLAQQAFLFGKHQLPGTTWPNGVMLFNVDALLNFPGDWMEGCGLATAVIQDPPLETTTIESPVYSRLGGRRFPGRR